MHWDGFPRESTRNFSFCLRCTRAAQTPPAARSGHLGPLRNPALAAATKMGHCHSPRPCTSSPRTFRIVTSESVARRQRRLPGAFLAVGHPGGACRVGECGFGCAASVARGARKPEERGGWTWVTGQKVGAGLPLGVALQDNPLVQASSERANQPAAPRLAQRAEGSAPAVPQVRLPLPHHTRIWCLSGVFRSIASNRACGMAF
jgi:hypothetical protein